MYRKCQTCGETKPISEFKATKLIKSGFYWDCRTCQAAKEQKYKEAVRRER